MSALLIHPRHTNQAPADARVDLTSHCINFLRNLLAILGPINANLAEAFSFSKYTNRTSRRSRNTLELDDGSSASDNEDVTEGMKGIIANRGRIRNCAKDFWQVVGWAFNCSVKYPKRWKYWKVWLDYMLDVLDTDWNERSSTGSDSGTVNSLLVKYLSEAKGRSSAMKRVVRSAFADGTPDSLKEFSEIFANETKELKPQNGQKRKRDSPVKHEFGDYNYDEAESELTEGTSQDEDDIDVNPWMGGPESIMLRQRVVTLVSGIYRDNFLCELTFSSCHGLLILIRKHFLIAKLSTTPCTSPSSRFRYPHFHFFFLPTAHPTFCSRLMCH